ncbi:shikimate dehydrogenase [Candidatus Electronema sp. TJ]|uniref:shikimate dehydrogenase n=1 Tax=Candidatus Electronema sp. TJ TaxID=3401573 RepID=UPI003AA8CD00
MPQINGSTELFGIIGNPVRHSLSPAMHNAAFASLGMNRVYVPMPVNDVAQAMSGLRSLGFRGASVTVPHKEAVIPFLDELDPVADKIGAVNTLLLRQDSEGRTIVRGFNTDWLGANAALAAAQVELRGKRVVVAGAGGAAKAVGFGLIEAGAEVVITNRTAESGQELAQWLNSEFIALDDLPWLTADVFINTTSVGMEPNTEGIIIPPHLLSKFSAVMDIVYAPLETRLLNKAKTAGCRTVDGLAMLLHQGAEQFRIWTGVPAPEQVMRAALEEGLLRRTICAVCGSFLR